MNIKLEIFTAITLVLAALMAACTAPARDPPPAQSSALQGTEWVLVSLNGGPLLEGTEITLRFGEASIEGSGGCNTYGGSYAASDEGLTLSDLYWTEMACLEPKGIMEQEQAYFQALNAAAHYQIARGEGAGDRLELYDEKGAKILTFVAAGSPSLIATIEAQESLPTGAVVGVRFTLTNVSSEGFYVLKWFTPLEGLAGDIFQVQRDGVELDYRGKLVKRGAPIPEDYVWIDAGGSISAEVDLAEGYDFTQAGRYTVQFRSPRLSHTAKAPGDQADSFDELVMIRIPSDPVSVTIGRP